MEDLSPTVAFDLLSHSHRRALLDCLDQHGCAISLADAAEEVLRMNGARPIQQIPAEEIKRVYMSLYHSHIPKLSKWEVVEYDRERDLVILATQGEKLVEFVNALDV